MKLTNKEKNKEVSMNKYKCVRRMHDKGNENHSHHKGHGRPMGPKKMMEIISENKLFEVTKKFNEFIYGNKELNNHINNLGRRHMENMYEIFEKTVKLQCLTKDDINEKFVKDFLNIIVPINTNWEEKHWQREIMHSIKQRHSFDREKYNDFLISIKDEDESNVYELVMNEYSNLTKRGAIILAKHYKVTNYSRKDKDQLIIDMWKNAN